MIYMIVVITVDHINLFQSFRVVILEHAYEVRHQIECFVSKKCHE